MYFRSLTTTKLYSQQDQTKQKNVEVNEEPIQYSKSAAYQYRARITRTGEAVQRLWYEPYVIMGSLTIFMIYFTIIREENDIDEELSKSLYSRIHGLEEAQLKLSLEYNKEHGMETEAILARLKEIKEKKILRKSFITLYNDIFNTDWTFLKDYTDVNTAVDALYYKFYEILDANVPLYKKRGKTYPRK
ncbi:hypothetical protein NQ318_010551 [Aromia moschata]|uniref:Uncharacterized protein n=1 Tax=Aromia moschata TaxID=1265417 RepID=A0AAV8X9T9_9CUCU|nr:hypothetical protein NQ318_010551 [Aromia moschata]